MLSFYLLLTVSAIRIVSFFLFLFAAVVVVVVVVAINAEFQFFKPQYVTERNVPGIQLNHRFNQSVCLLSI